MSQISQTFTEEDWLDRLYRKSESQSTRNSGQTTLNMFELFCNYNNTSKTQMIKKYQELFNQTKPDIRSICLSIDKFINFLDKDHDDIILNSEYAPTPFKRKSPGTIKVYFVFLKSYLRICHGVRITSDDVKDYVTFPKKRKEQRKPISIETLKIIFNNASPERRALYYVLVSSGMRIGEALSLKKKNFHLDATPIRITLEAEDTKTKEARETYITSEAFDKVKPLLKIKGDNDYIFTNKDNVDDAVLIEEQYFGWLRRDLHKRLGEKEGEGMLEKYNGSSRYVINIHAFRSYFHTKASQKHGSDYANALDGHGSYLKQYYREDPKERAKKYKELEPNLLIESLRPESDKTKDKIIEDLQNQMEMMRAAMVREGIMNQ